jgi:hypothetical protein
MGLEIEFAQGSKTAENNLPMGRTTDVVDAEKTYRLK